MIIDLTISKIFTRNLDNRFAREYALPAGVWLEVWRRYKLLEYSNGDLRDFLFIKYARNLNTTSMSRWIIRGEIYSIANPLIKKGVKHVNTEIFGEYEEFLMNELVKPLRNGATRKSDSII